MRIYSSMPFLSVNLCPNSRLGGILSSPEAGVRPSRPLLAFRLKDFSEQWLAFRRKEVALLAGCR
jgi:hypothetical protein